MRSVTYPCEKLKGMVGQPFWCIHHKGTRFNGVCIPLEFATEPIENRVAYIKAEKPKSEQATRLNALRPVKGPLPPAVVEAWQKCDEAWQKHYEAYQKYEEAWQKCDEAWQKYDEARQKLYAARQKYDETIFDCRHEIMALFSQECPDVSWLLKGGLVFELVRAKPSAW